MYTGSEKILFTSIHKMYKFETSYYCQIIKAFKTHKSEMC